MNTGWNGSGKRISLKDTRAIIDSILDGSIEEADSVQIPIFNLDVPTQLPGVDSSILDPRKTYSDVAEWENKAKEVAQLFTENFKRFTDTPAGAALVKAGPVI